ncbi:MAG: Rieske 2Fe-2S domain-containing protein, partial [Geminicoccaceae bacterium]
MSDRLSSLDDLLRGLGEAAARPMERAVGLPPMLYWKDDVAALETEQIFRRDWVCAGLAAELAEVGDHLSFSIAGEPIFCVRDAAGAIRTFSNACRHRMMRLVG